MYKYQRFRTRTSKTHQDEVVMIAFANEKLPNIKNNTRQSPRGTVRGESRFSASGTAKEIHEAFRGTGTDEALIIDILSSLSNDQRLDLADEYMRRYDKVNKVAAADFASSTLAS